MSTVLGLLGLCIGHGKYKVGKKSRKPLERWKKCLHKSAVPKIWIKRLKQPKNRAI